MLTTRFVLRALPLAVGALALGMAAMADSLIVKTADGKVQGKRINEGKVRAFQGIPYAAPPIGDLRWKAPQPAAAWKGDLDATRYGHHCVQGEVYSDMVFQDSTGPNDIGSEDCLTLNVFTPSHSSFKTKLPVMLWIHGGGYGGGSSSEPRHNGDFLPTKRVVLVTINYRLSVFGFLALPELTAEQGGASGNYGLMDMVAALKWVKMNIADFGGDPDNVTIFGESAGSYAVSTLMAAPSARGLFHRAIGESGGALPVGSSNSGTLPMRNRDAVEPGNAAWQKASGANSLAELRAMSTEKILAAARRKEGPSFAPVVDGKFLPEPMSEIYNKGKQAHVPLLAGFNRDEEVGLGQGMTSDKWKTFSMPSFAEKLELFFKLYPGTTNSEAIRSAIDFDGDRFISYGTWKWIELDRNTGDKEIYRYKFDLAAPPSMFHPGAYAFHSDDIEYVFGTLDTRPGATWRDEDRKLSDQIMSYWTNFARKGDPNGRDGSGQELPLWPKYGEGDPVLHLDNPITWRHDENRARYELWLSVEK